MKKILLFLLLFNLTGTIVFAQVRISEIMYDLEGTDTKREWVEVENIGASDVELTLWKLFENDTNHGITHVGGTATLAPGSFAIIADDTSTFLLDWPSYSLALFDSSFSLKNTGELLEMRNKDGVKHDQVTYSPEWGAEGDGNSLQKSSGSWIAALPTPGVTNATSAVPSSENNNEEDDNNSESTEETPSSEAKSGGTSFEVEPQIFANAGSDRDVVVGADAEFRGEAIGLKGLTMEAERYLWNFGDGFSKEGKAIFHTYHHPGTYVVTLSVSSGKYSASDRVIIEAREAEIRLNYAGNDRIELSNEGDFALDLSWWILESGATSFTLPKNTTLLPQSPLILVNEATNLIVQGPEDVRLLYPNGVPVSFFDEGITPERTIFTSAAIVSSQSVDSNTVAVEPHTTPTEEVVSKEESSVPEEQIASSFAAAGDLPASDTNFYKWLLALVSILSVASIAALVVRQNKRDDEIEIID